MILIETLSGPYLHLNGIPKGLRIVGRKYNYDAYYASPWWIAWLTKLYLSITIGNLNPKWLLYKSYLLNTPEWDLISYRHFSLNVYKTYKYREGLRKRNQSSSLIYKELS